MARNSEKKAERPQARTRHRIRPIQTPGADLRSGGSTKDGDARVPEVLIAESPHGT